MNTTYEPTPGNRWTYGDEVGKAWFNGRAWHREITLYGPCPACGTVCGSYGGGWRCHALYCYYNADNPAPSMGKMPDWWNTGITVFRDGASWCATDVGFVNVQESDAGFGDSPSAAVKDLRQRQAPRHQRSPLQIPLAIAILVLCLGARLDAAAAVHLEVQVVDLPTWRLDVAPGWIERYRQDKATMTWDLVVPELGSAIPVPNLAGAFDAAAWTAFTASPTNPVKNAFRLLGPPTSIERLPGGELRVVWAGARLINTAGIGLAGDTAAVALEADESKSQFTWRYLPPAKNSM